MADARLIKALERRGFLMGFPDYTSSDEIIIEILKSSSSRILLGLSILLKEEFDYKRIITKINKKQKEEFDKAILISEKMYNKENIINNLKNLIKKERIRQKFLKEEFEEFYNAFKESQINLEKKEQRTIEKQSKLRLNLDLNKSLKILFSPAKIRIMNKIFNHEELTNTELKYYYRAISNINKSVLNPVLQDYLRIIEITKKESEIVTR